MTDRQKIRSAKIRQKERSAVLNDITDQKDDRKRSSDIKEMMMMMMMMQQQQQFQQQQQQQQLISNMLMMKLFGGNSTDLSNLLQPKPPTNTQPNTTQDHNINSDKEL